MSTVGKGMGESAKARRGVNWRLVLAWYLRTLALAWLLKGLASWAAILGVEHLGYPPFEGQRFAFQAATIFFAIIDLVAGVGLWFLAAWGGVVWLIAVCAKLALAGAMPHAAPTALASAGIFVALAALFAILQLLAARQKQE